MAKKKKDIDSDDGDSLIDLAQRSRDEIEKKYGVGVLSSANSIVDVPRKIISVCPSVDYAFAGGLTKGNWFVMNGPPKLGKSALGLKALASCQKDGMRTVFSNIEHRLKMRDLLGVEGLDVNKLEVIESTKGNILSAEKHFAILYDILSSDTNCAILVDSFSMMNESAKQDEFGKETRGKIGHYASDFCNSMTSIVPLHDHIIMGVTHTIANTSGFGPSKVEKSPNSIIYVSDFKLKGWKDKGWEWKDSDGERIGQRVTWECEFSGLGGGGRKVVSHLRYGIGYDDLMEYLVYGEEFGLLKLAGAWLTLFPDDVAPPMKTQGFDKMWHKLRHEDNLELKNRLISEVRPLLGLPALT